MPGFDIDTGDSGGSGGSLDEDDSTDDVYDDSGGSSSDDDDDDDTGGLVDSSDSEYTDDPRNDPDNWDGNSPDEDDEETDWDDIDFSDGDDGGVGGIVPDEDDQVDPGDYAIPEELRATDGETLREAIGGYLGVSVEDMEAVTMEQMTDLRNAVIEFNTGDQDAGAAAFTEAANAIIETAQTGQAPVNETEQPPDDSEEPEAPAGLPPELLALLNGERTTQVGGQEVPTVALVGLLGAAGYVALGGGQ